jgi:hypothetical protein
VAARLDGSVTSHRAPGNGARRPGERRAKDHAA